MLKKYTTKIQDLESNHKPLMAKFYIVLAVLSMVNAQGMIRISNTSLAQMLYHRGLLIVISNVLIFSKRPSIDDPSKDFYIRPIPKMYICLLSTIILAISTPFFLMGMKMISIGETHVLVSSNTIWGQFIAVYLLNETLTWSRIRNIAISIMGLIFIVRPPFIFENFGAKSSKNEQHFIGSTLVLCCAFVQACSFSLVKKLGEQVPPNIQTTYFHTQIILVSGIMFAIDETMITQITFDYSWKLVVIALFSYASHVLTYRAYSLYSFAKLAPLQFLGVVYGIIIDVVFFQNVPGLLSILGCTLVLGAVVSATQEKID